MIHTNRKFLSTLPKKILATILVFGLLSLFDLPTISAQDLGILRIENPEIYENNLPDPLVFPDGTPVRTIDQWEDVRKSQILEVFRTQVYGKAPGAPENMRFVVNEIDTFVFEGKATRKQISIYFDAGNESNKMDLLMYVPNKMTKPVPAFLGLNFAGNHAVYPDPKIEITEQWVRNTYNNKSGEEYRGFYEGRWPVEFILDRGYALITAYYGDLDPDYDNFMNGIHPLFYKKGQNHPDSSEWGAIGAWAWGLMRGMDYLETDKDIDASKVAIIGHSRLGKTALWAAAQDRRFAMAISNSSGTGGAALSRRRFSETVELINKRFSWWFADNFKKYNDNEDSLAVDQHELIALIAPRPVYIQASTLDLTADPYGQFLTAKFASPLYELYGYRGLDCSEMPAVNHPVMTGRIGFHIRPGAHGVYLYDWMRYLDFADLYLK